MNAVTIFMRQLRLPRLPDSCAGTVVRRGGGGFIARPVDAATSSRRVTGVHPNYRFSMPDIHRWPENDRTIAAAVVLQLHAGIDPDYSRSLAERIVFAIDRAGMRGHTDAAPTADEIARAQNALARRGIAASAEDVAYALDAAFVRGWTA